MAMIECEGWKYEFNRKDARKAFTVIPPFELKRPKTFYKYYALSEHSVDALLKKYLYASHPYQLNDVFDCGSSLIRFTKQSQRFLLGSYYKAIAEYVKKDESLLENCVHEVFNWRNFSKLGIVSLAGINTQNYYWAHYAENKGFCVEFDLENLPFDSYGPFPVQYYDVTQPMIISIPHIPDAVLLMTNVKGTEWSVEKEWRLLCATSDCEQTALELYDLDPMVAKSFRSNPILRFRERKFYYGNSTYIKSVTLGPRFFDGFDFELEKGIIRVNKCGMSLQYKVVDNVVKNGINLKYLKSSVPGKFVDNPVVIEDMTSDTICLRIEE